MGDHGRFEGKVVVVTGGGRGIGRGCALRFASEGADVAICGRTEQHLRRTAGEIEALGGKALVRVLDVSDEAAVEGFIADVVRELGTIDVLVNNASLTGMSDITSGPLVDMTTADWNRVMDVNLTSMFFASRAAGKVMRAKSSGAIVNVSSVHAFRPNGIYPHYDVAKAGIEGLTRNLALNLGQHGIRVNAIAPGPIDVREPGSVDSYSPEEREAQRTGTVLGRMGTPDEVGALVAFLASEEASYITGVCVPVDGGFLIRHSGMSTGS